MAFDQRKLKDKNWRLSHLYAIIDIDGNLITFKRNRSQIEFNKQRGLRNIILKSRKLGFTTDESLDSFDDVLFTPNFDALMLSYDIPSQLDIFDSKIMLAWDNFPDDVKSMWIVDAQRANKLKFGHGDGSFSSIVVRTKGRSGTFRRIHISEFGRICKTDPTTAKEIMAGTIQAAPLNARVDIESTAMGVGGQFYNMFWEAWERGEPIRPVDFKAHFFNWTYDDKELEKIKTPDTNLPKEFLDYQVLHKLTDVQITYYYYKWLTLNKDWDLLHQEYPTTPEEAFVTSGRTLFNGQKLDKMPLHDGLRVGNWTYFDDYVPGHRYALGADPSEGYGGDAATIAVIDFDHKDERRLIPKVVAEFADNKIQPHEFAFEIKSGGQAYGNCIAGVERNGPGLAVLTKLREIYFNIYTTERMDKFTNQPTEKLGWITNIATKPKMIYDLSGAVNNDDIIIPSRATIRELKNYDPEDLSRIRFDDKQVSHWDRVIALAIAYQMASKAIPSELRKDPDENREIDKGEVDVLDKYNVFPRF
jgi:hypothetical protein